LSMDLPRLCDASGTGAEIFLWQLPLFPASAAWGCDPKEQALHGGEDFELLFSIRAEKIPRFESAYPRRLPRAHRIGRLTKKRGIVCIDAPGKHPRPLPELGFDHFGKGIARS
jgi:thiamine-monophosphate kinase